MTRFLKALVILGSGLLASGPGMGADCDRDGDNNISLVEIPAPDEKTVWEDESYGIRAAAEFERHGDRSLHKKVQDYAQTVFHGAEYSAKTLNKRVNAKLTNKKFPQFKDADPIGEKGKQGLIIFFHGLNGAPDLWDAHVEVLKDYAQFDVVAPAIPEEGNCTLNGEDFHHYLGRIVDWTTRNPKKPVALFGQSNGTRVAVRFETWLRKTEPKTPVYVSLTGGVLFGSKTAAVVAPLTLRDAVVRVGPKYDIYKDLAYGSDYAKALLKELREPLADNVADRFYTMYAPYHDHHVYSLGSALPVINPDKQKSKQERHYIVYNYGHNAIPTAVAKRQISECIDWMKRCSE